MTNTLTVLGVCSALAGGGWTGPPAADIPPAYVAAYQQASQVCPGLDWTTLAAIGRVETDHGREAGTAVTAGENEAGAAGPMQFLQDTFEQLQLGHRDVLGDRYDLGASTRAAAHFLCENGAPTEMDRALYAYNPTRAYVQHVQRQAAEYRAAVDAERG